MMRLLYPLIASALITVTPFLLMFEKGQDIVRGLFDYEAFALLLLFALVKNRIAWPEILKNRKRESVAAKCRIFLLLSLNLFFMVALLVVAWIDLENLLAVKNFEMGWYWIVPLLTVGLAIAMMSRVRAFSLNGVGFVLLVALLVHLITLDFYPAQPLGNFPILDYISRTYPSDENRKKLPKNFGDAYLVSDSVSIAKNYVDTTRSNVIVLVESWGIPRDSLRCSKIFDFFSEIPNQLGVHARMYSRTRTAERENLTALIVRDSVGRRDSTFLPQVFLAKGYETSFLYAGDSVEFWRNKYIRKIGFFNTFFEPAFNDELMAEKIDSLLSTEPSQKKFIAWTTRDTKFPLPGFEKTYSANVNAVDSAYLERLAGTMRSIAGLAKKHPSVRFVVDGDHEPILSPKDFQKKFYKRWVPYVILN